MRDWAFKNDIHLVGLSKWHPEISTKNNSSLTSAFVYFLRWNKQTYMYCVSHISNHHTCSAAKNRKAWVAQRTNHGGSLGGPCHLWVDCICDVVRNDNETAMSLCVIYFQPVPKRHMIDNMCSLITLKFDRLLGNNTAKSPVIFQSKRLYKTLLQIQVVKRSLDKTSYSLLIRGSVSMSRMWNDQNISEIR